MILLEVKVQTCFHEDYNLYNIAITYLKIWFREIRSQDTSLSLLAGYFEYFIFEDEDFLYDCFEWKYYYSDSFKMGN